MATCGQCRASVQPGTKNCWNCGITLSGAAIETLPGTGAHAGPAVQDPMIGRTVIDQYIIRSKIGEGGMGAVYLAEQPSIGRNAVIKVIHPWLSRDPGIAHRFRTEARAAARLQNPHIVSIYNYGKMADGTLFLAMEHLVGCTLDTLIEAEGKLEPSRVVAIATQCCEALAEAHRRQVVHRDLKPSNIMLVSRGGGPDFVKVLDFGIAKLEGGEMTSTGAMLGTPKYMAPEQLCGQPVDGRADIYALALIIYEMLSGKPPFEADSPAAYMHRHLNEQPPSLATTCPGIHVSPALEACIMRALAKGPYQRPQNADRFADDLWSSLMATVGDNSHLPMPITRPKGASAGVVLAAVLGVATFLAVFGVVGFIASRSNDVEVADAEDPAGAPADLKEVAPPPSVAGNDEEIDEERAALMSRSITDLETELQRVTILSGHPRESIELSLREYHEAARRPPQGQDPVQYRKALLADLIIAWRQVRAETPPPDRTLDELEAMFLTMPSPLTVQKRKEMLHDLKARAAENTDPEWAIKVKLLQWIDMFAEDTGVELRILDDEDGGSDG